MASKRLPTLFSHFQQLPGFTTLTAGQVEFARLFFKGENLLLTGAAGVGKSYLIKMLFDFVHSEGISIGKSALTGVAAFNIGGQTLHSFAGLGLAEEDVKDLIQIVRKKKKAVARISACDILIIDEASMMKAELLDKLDVIMKYFRFNNAPFGGCQIVFVGDWLQLPPIWRGGETKDFCFNARSWKEAAVKVVELKEIMRQVGDPAFAAALNKIRTGDVSGLDLIRTRIGAVFPNEKVEPVRIFCKNVDVDELNAEKLRALPGEIKSYRAFDTGQEHHIAFFDKNCPAPRDLKLKIGAQVMLLHNVDTEIGLVNGSVGVVKSFSTHGPVVSFRTGDLIVEENRWETKEQEPRPGGGYHYKVVASRTQIPLRLAWAITTHKAMGSTLDRAIIDMSEAFAEGQVYTSLSRVRSLDCLSIVDFPSSRIRVNEECLQFYRDLA